jgi:WXG100 family type VII secretion target
VNPAAVSSASAATNRTYTQIEALLGTINGQIRELQSEFTGVGGQALQDLFTQLYQTLTTANGELEAIGTKLNITATNASELQANLVRMFSSA